MELLGLNEVSDFVMGQAPHSSTYNDTGEGDLLIKAGDFGELYPTPETYTTSPIAYSQLGDIIICVVGATSGKVNLGINASITRSVAALRPKDKTDMKFLYYLLKGSYSKLNRAATGSAQGILNKTSLSNFKIPLPPLDQQKQIAKILDTADSYRQKTKALIEKYDDLTQSLFLEMFGDPVTNLKGWKEVIFTDVLVLRRGFDLPVQDRVQGDYPIMASNGVLDWHNEFKVEGPGVVTGRSGTLGKVHLVQYDYWPLNTALYSQDLKGNNPLYLLYLLRNFQVERFTRGAGVPTLNRNLVHAEKIMDIPKKLQNLFAERVQAIEAQKALAQQELEKSEELFNSLLQKAFKGELV